ncbi:MAG: rhodanese-related sulfurtransferase [Methylophilaceae bacterium]|nr:rhodanese-related sulfurtransferase [Methylophilaceae bacterium]
MNTYLTSTFYHFVELNDYKNLQAPIQRFCNEKMIKGTILLANEGINGTLSGDEEVIRAFHKYIKTDPLFNTKFKDLVHKDSWAAKNPFYRMKVRLKKEIVALGVSGVSPIKKVGQYVKPSDWNQLISDPNTIVIDTRNGYEIDIGSFKGAINPNTETFREFPEYIDKKLVPNKNKKIAMFCTGGIRCEKATSLMLEKGFDNVYHLQGGILKYLEEVPEDKSLWEGECFVFDQRVAVTHNLLEGDYDQCFACRHPLSPDEIKSPEYNPGVSCPYCYNKITEEKKASVIERQKQILLAKARGELHIGKNLSKNKIKEAKEWLK